MGTGQARLLLEGSAVDGDNRRRHLAVQDQDQQGLRRSTGMPTTNPYHVDPRSFNRTTKPRPEPIKKRWALLVLMALGPMVFITYPRHHSLPDNAPMAFGPDDQHQQMLLHPGLDHVVTDHDTGCVMGIVWVNTTAGNGDVVQATLTPRSQQASCTIEKSYALGTSGQWSDYDHPDSSAEAVGDFTYPLPVDMFALRLCERSGKHCQVTLMVPWPPNAGPMPTSRAEPDD